MSFSREQNCGGEEGPTADEDDELARESEGEIEPSLEDDENDYGYSKQAVEDEDEDEWQDDNEDLLDDKLGAEDGEDEGDEDLGSGEF